MRATEVKKKSKVLKSLLHDAILDSVRFVTEKCETLGTKPQEPDFIAALCLKFTPTLFNCLNAVFPRKKFSVTGIFCHQKPVVDIGLGKNPELGDILFLYLYKDKMGNRLMNSLLFQAKISKSLISKVSTGDQHQLELYTKWPQFTYKSAGTLNRQTRDVLPKTINDGAQYLMIDDHPFYGLSGHPGTFPMGCEVPAKILNLDNRLSDELVDFIKFKSGRIVENDPTSTKDDWTRMIWDLLEIAKEVSSKRKNIGISEFPRITTAESDGLCFFQADAKSILSDFHEKLPNMDNSFQNRSFIDEENRACSVILIESDEENEGL
ncbi:hypothetical protein [Cognataquiflexum rubidum]|uniref:hypothetical protein n=1 Tax=Cognataquiflexum rubidum TaxID=2922273 RepID=UPI001F1467A8|nr:hypothetical protein [Cognataquiflexum rubidum]MCH6236666.1 hypothetical protein [Cognataquiflexum rubidum]